MTDSLLTLDVRPILRSGGEPFPEIMQAIANLKSGQGLRLLATFKPAPLFSVMQKKGFTHCEKELSADDWEIIFRPEDNAPVAVQEPGTKAAKPGQDDASGWPAPSQSLDNRGMMPPEPMVITLEAIENMTAGKVLEGWYDRDPLLLYPELQTRGHQAHCEKLGPNDYRVLIRCGNADGAQAGSTA
jgi:uncharacterized protein (DUF2249 family)